MNWFLMIWAFAGIFFQPIGWGENTVPQGDFVAMGNALRGRVLASFLKEGMPSKTAYKALGVPTMAGGTVHSWSIYYHTLRVEVEIRDQKIFKVNILSWPKILKTTK